VSCSYLAVSRPFRSRARTVPRTLRAAVNQAIVVAGPALAAVAGLAASVDAVTDPLAGLLDLADCRAAFDTARAAVDDALRHPALRRSGGPVAAEVGLRSAVASAALEDHGYELDAVRAGTITDPVLQGALRVSGALDGLAATWSRAPRQVLARLHVLAARDAVPADDLGRPTTDPMIAARLDALAGVVTTTTAPAMVAAAVVHGELLALSPFAGPSGVVARGAGRLALIAGGLDPRGLLAIDVGHLERAPEYRGAAGAFATGTRDGVRSWLKHYAAAVTVAAGVLTEVANNL
jgi:hypothetical protein